MGIVTNRTYVICAIVLLQIPLVYWMSTRRSRPVVVSKVPDTKATRELCEYIRQIGQKSLDELIEDLGDDWISRHTELYMDEGPATSWFFDAVVANPLNLKLNLELEQGFSSEQRPKRALEIFEKHFTAFWEQIDAQTKAKEEVSRVLRERGLKSLTQKDFHQNRHLGINKFPEGWKDLTERTNAILNATFLVATYCNPPDIFRSISRFQSKQAEINDRLTAIEYPSIDRDNVGLEPEFLVNILWYGSDPGRAGDSVPAKALRRVIEEAVSNGDLKRIRSEMPTWTTLVQTYDSKEARQSTSSSNKPTSIDRIRWSWSDVARMKIMRAVLKCIQ